MFLFLDQKKRNVVVDINKSIKPFYCERVGMNSAKILANTKGSSADVPVK